ncbi:hypothetical protein FRC11_001006 [Ceratobasidium sp. 423]|nr:hypothetical protein FRC11_001006 [Ceratobasidium sp. 423]
MFSSPPNGTGPPPTSEPFLYFNWAREALDTPELLDETVNHWASPDLISSAVAPGGFVPAAPFQPLQTPNVPTPQVHDGLLGYTSFPAQVDLNYVFPSPSGHTTPAGNVVASSQPGDLTIQAPGLVTLYPEQPAAEYLPTPESFLDSLEAFGAPVVGDNWNNAMLESFQLPDYVGPDQTGVVWGQQVPAFVAGPPTYQPHSDYNTFIPPPSQLQPLRNRRVPPSESHFTFEAPVPAAVPMAYPPVVGDATLFQYTNMVSLDRTYSTPALPTPPGPSRPARSKSVLRLQPYDPEGQARKGSLKRDPSTGGPSSSHEGGAKKRRKSSSWKGHSSIPQGNWQQELQELNLNAEGKYYKLFSRRGSVESATDMAKAYACLYTDPITNDHCWTRMGCAQPREWLIAVSNGLRKKGRKGFYPRHEAEMLRHLAVHRMQEAYSIRAMPNGAQSATVWQHQLIDAQIIKDRDDPGNQFWYPDEIRKSREQLNEELAVSPFYRK